MNVNKKFLFTLNSKQAAYCTALQQNAALSTSHCISLTVNRCW